MNNTVTQRTDYINGMEVTPSTLTTVVHLAGGRLVKQVSGIWDPQYYYTDHRGDIRVVYHANATTGTAEVVQEDHLTPLGVQMVGMSRTNWPENQYRYQGKELNTIGFDTNGDNVTDSRLYQYDFGARQYDPLIGRWHSADPMMQYVSPYMAMGNDWVNRVDPTGMEDDMAKYIRAYYQEINQRLLTEKRNRAEEHNRIYGRGEYVGNPAFYWRSTLMVQKGGSGGGSTFQIATFSDGSSINTGNGGEIEHHNTFTRSDGRTGSYVQIGGEIIYTPNSDVAPFMYTDVICQWTDFPGVDTYHSNNPEDYHRPYPVFEDGQVSGTTVVGIGGNSPAVTLPSIVSATVVVGNKTAFLSNENRYWQMHEYGHYLQYLEYSALYYYGVIAVGSSVSVNNGSEFHNAKPWELDATIRAYQHFWDPMIFDYYYGKNHTIPYNDLHQNN